MGIVAFRFESEHGSVELSGLQLTVGGVDLATIQSEFSRPKGERCQLSWSTCAQKGSGSSKGIQ